MASPQILSMAQHLSNWAQNGLQSPQDAPGGAPAPSMAPEPSQQPQEAQMAPQQPSAPMGPVKQALVNFFAHLGDNMAHQYGLPTRAETQMQQAQLKLAQVRADSEGLDREIKRNELTARKEDLQARTAARKPANVTPQLREFLGIEGLAEMGLTQGDLAALIKTRVSADAQAERMPSLLKTHKQREAAWDALYGDDPGREDERSRFILTGNMPTDRNPTEISLAATAVLKKGTPEGKQAEEILEKLRDQRGAALEMQQARLALAQQGMELARERFEEAKRKAQMPTTATRSMAETAPKVLNFIDRILPQIAMQEQRLGPMMSRWNEFMAGSVGAPNKEFIKLRTNVQLLSTLLMRMHVGARGGVVIMESFKDLMDSGKQSPENLRAALQEIQAYAQDINSLNANTGAPQAEEVIDWERGPDGTPRRVVR